MQLKSQRANSRTRQRKPFCTHFPKVLFSLSWRLSSLCLSLSLFEFFKVWHSDSEFKPDTRRRSELKALSSNSNQSSFNPISIVLYAHCSSARKRLSSEMRACERASQSSSSSSDSDSPGFLVLWLHRRRRITAPPFPHLLRLSIAIFVQYAALTRSYAKRRHGALLVRQEWKECENDCKPSPRRKQLLGMCLSKM